MKIQNMEGLTHNLQVHQIELEVQAEELRRVQLDLAESRDQYLDLYEFAPIGYLTLTDKAMISRANLTLSVLLGVDRSNLVNTPFRRWVVHEDLETWNRYFTNLLQSEKKLTATLVLKRGDGETFPARLESIRLTDLEGGLTKVRVAISDISEITKTEKALRTSEERLRLAEEAQVASEIPYRRLFETAQDGILILDADTGQIVEVNPFLITMLGFSRDQFLGKKLWEIGLFKDIVANKENFEELQRKEYVRYEDMPIETADGQRIAVEFLSNVYTVNNKKVIQCNIRDISVRKKLEEDLVVKAAELARSNVELQQFAYIASHDLQEPLRAISGFTELLVKRYHGKIDEKADTYIDFITEGTTRMQQMIQDLLSYSRVQTQVHEFVSIDSNTSLDLALSDLQVATKEHNAVITNDPLPSIFADQEQITKMFQNLIGNAIKFHKPDVVPNIHISSKQDGNNWIFSVSDNGIGIDQEYADRIFKIFQRLHTRGEYPGTGIGLAICKRIAEQHGGTIWIESVPGSGSTFYFTIPKRTKETNHE